MGELVALPGSADWEPTEADLQVNLGRLRAKLAAPPRAGFYRHCGEWRWRVAKLEREAA